MEGPTIVWVECGVSNVVVSPVPCICVWQRTATLRREICRDQLLALAILNAENDKSQQSRKPKEPSSPYASLQYSTNGKSFILLVDLESVVKRWLVHQTLIWPSFAWVEKLAEAASLVCVLKTSSLHFCQCGPLSARAASTKETTTLA